MKQITGNRGRLKKTIEGIVKMVVMRGAYRKNWFSEEYDPDKAYPVDFVVSPPSGQDLFIFGIRNEVSSLRAANTCRRYRQLQLPFTPVAIYENREQVPPHAVTAVEEVIEKVFPSIDYDRERIAHYIAEVAA